MVHSIFDDATERYQLAERVEFATLAVPHKLFHSFSCAMRELENILGQSMEEPYWRGVVQPLRQFGFNMAVAPLPFGSEGGIGGVLSSQQTVELARCESQYPAAAPILRQVLALRCQLASRPENPLMTAIHNHYQAAERKRTAIILRVPKLIPTVEFQIENGFFKDLTVLSPTELVHEMAFDYAFVIGVPQRFPDHLLCAPRARHVAFVMYDWFRSPNRLKPLLGFAANSATSCLIHHQPISRLVSDSQSGNLVDVDTFEDVDSLSESEWQALSIRTKSTNETTASEEVTAHLVVTESGSTVFLDASEEATSLIIDLREEGDDRVERVVCSDLEPGMFILLRTEGGGDYIAPLAEKLLGSNGSVILQTQNEWKSKFAAHVMVNGPLKTSIQLLDLGAGRHAEEPNVRNWASNRNIRPQEEADFGAILRLIGLEKSASRYIAAAVALDGAHRKAGHQIRKALLQQVGRADLKRLEREGIMEFHLSEGSTAGLTAFRIKAISPSVYAVQQNHIGVPHPPETI